MAVITTTRVFTRPAKNISWYQHSNIQNSEDSEAFGDYLINNYIRTGKILNRTSTSNDLTLTVVITWASTAAMNSHYSDPVVIAHFAKRDAYNEENNIVNELVVG